MDPAAVDRLMTMGPVHGSTELALKLQWGARGSNPEPTDGEKHARLQRPLDQQRCLTWHATNAHMTLGSPRASVYAPVHAKNPA
jgi:hypothetical protein